jgi:hypothetical protein
VDPAACARAKKAERLVREATLDTLDTALNPKPESLPSTPEEAAQRAYREYRRHTRPFRRVFRGIITRRDAERFLIARMRKTQRAIEAAEETSGDAGAP